MPLILAGVVVVSSRYGIMAVPRLSAGGASSSSSDTSVRRSRQVRCATAPGHPADRVTGYPVQSGHVGRTDPTCSQNPPRRLSRKAGFQPWFPRSSFRPQNHRFSSRLRQYTRGGVVERGTPSGRSPRACSRNPRRCPPPASTQTGFDRANAPDGHGDELIRMCPARRRPLARSTNATHRSRCRGRACPGHESGKNPAKFG